MRWTGRVCRVALIGGLCAAGSVAGASGVDPGAEGKPSQPPATVPAPAPAGHAPAKATFPDIKPKQLWADNDLRGKRAPKLEVEKWLTDQPDTEGKVVIVDFWATWCPPCRALIPELNELQNSFKADLVVIGISDEQEEKLKRFIPGSGVAYAQAMDTKATTKNLISVQGIPHVLVIDSTGIVRWQGFPLNPEDRLTEGVVRRIIDADKAQRPRTADPRTPPPPPSQPPQRSVPTGETPTPVDK